MEARRPVSYVEKSRYDSFGARESFGWRNLDNQGAREDGGEVRIGCLASAYAGCYCVSNFETPVVLVRIACRPLDVTLLSVEMLKQWE